MHHLKVRRIGNSLGVILSADAAHELKVGEGDSLYLTSTPDGLRVTPYDPAFAEQLRAAEEGMRKYRNALRELAR